jgi:diguanylate cyclase (GGDEF)-like protein
VAVIALIGGLLWLTAIQNRAESQSEQARVAAAFNDRVKTLRANAQIFAMWDEAAMKLAVGFDPLWADVNEAQYLYQQFGYEHAFVVDGLGRTLYASTKGVRSTVDPADLIGGSYLPALTAAASDPSPRAVAGVSDSSEGAIIFGISRIRGNSAAVDRLVRFHRFLVTTKRIDAQLVEEVGLLSRGPNAVTFGGSRATGAGSWEVPTYDRKVAGTLLWKPASTGNQLRRDVLPWLALLIALLVGLAARVLLRSRDALKLVVANQVRANYLAEHDVLTGLPNRRAFTAHLEDIRLAGNQYVLFFMDLDGFKEVNDTFGHPAGDALLRETAERLVRGSPENSYVARIGGDEFAVVVEHEMPPHELGSIAARLAEMVRAPHEFGGAPTIVGVSIGIAASEHQKDDDVIRKADSAMYAAKVERRDGWKIYSPSIQKSQWDRKEMENDLRCAIANGEISLVFQPIMRVKDKRVIAMEALARWAHPRKGDIPPDVFIPIAEESGLIVELGKHILRTACTAARDWPYKLSVNLSPAQFWDRGLVEGIVETLAETAFPATRLEFEITETYLNRRTEAAARIVTELRDIGASIALDDFGAGYASIAYLRAFEFDVVKVDRSIVKRAGQNPQAAEMLVAIVALCNALKLPCLAEGVETEAEAAICSSAGCQFIQGWYVGHPVPAAEVVWKELRAFRPLQLSR